jgi:predicted Zn-dependent peptidase
VHFVGGSALFGLPEQLETIAEQVAKVTAEDIQQAVQRHFDPDDAHLTCVGVLEGDLLADVRGLVRA